MSKRGIMALSLTLALIGAIGSPAQKRSGPAQPSAESKRLGVFVGVWKDEAVMKPSPFGPGGKMSLTQTCKWFTGGFSVICNTDTTGFMGKIKTLTLLNYDAGEKIYTLYELNDTGIGDFQKGTVEGNTWTWTSAAIVDGKSVRGRATLKLPTPESATMVTDFSMDDGPWFTVMELKGRRVQ